MPALVKPPPAFKSVRDSKGSKTVRRKFVVIIFRRDVLVWGSELQTVSSLFQRELLDFRSIPETCKKHKHQQRSFQEIRLD